MILAGRATQSSSQPNCNALELQELRIWPPHAFNPSYQDVGCLCWRTAPFRDREGKETGKRPSRWQPGLWETAPGQLGRRPCSDSLGRHRQRRRVVLDTVGEMWLKRMTSREGSQPKESENRPAVVGREEEVASRGKRV